MMKPWEIQVLVKHVTNRGKALCLLYKDARYDMAALDEKFGVYGWKKSYKQIGDMLFCSVSVWDKDKEEWIEREDVGAETQVGEEKGHASDAFKRACYNFGIGRELYSAPDIWIDLDKSEIGSYKSNRGKEVYTCRQKFYVQQIGYNDAGNISYLEISDTHNRKRFTWTIETTPLVAIPAEPDLEELRSVARTKVEKTVMYPQEWKNKVLKGLPGYDESTLKRLVNETLKGE